MNFGFLHFINIYYFYSCSFNPFLRYENYGARRSFIVYTVSKLDARSYIAICNVLRTNKQTNEKSIFFFRFSWKTNYVRVRRQISRSTHTPSNTIENLAVMVYGVCSILAKFLTRMDSVCDLKCFVMNLAFVLRTYLKI